MCAAELLTLALDHARELAYARGHLEVLTRLDDIESCPLPTEPEHLTELLEEVNGLLRQLRATGS